MVLCDAKSRQQHEKGPIGMVGRGGVRRFVSKAKFQGERW